MSSEVEGGRTVPESIEPRGGTIDSDIDVHSPAQRRELHDHPVTVLTVIAAGGALGALGRYGLTQLWPTPGGGFPWATFGTNVLGCFLIGVLMVVITDIRTMHPLTRPFLGVGILGGFTTFSTYANETRGLLQPGTVPLAFAYMAATLLCALLATLAAVALTRGLHSTLRREAAR
ncbi:chromosome condensation protein CrcB [Nocardia sp. SYP-A9097]|uniref:FluC/FEX family fluoride channel n=1 Tax=Nocardia sp. SYP-A9097 TaxID=2663237 RepID=UPI00129A14AA|nr:CrcB family protein [Nocardia sp. SYP-A9097]MRH90782.1 chromosome condensation protein CrcB [Nocardia sp. SYP-A9097]